MPIAKRLTPEERLRKTLPDHWRKALHHPIMKQLSYGERPVFDPTPQNVSRAINMTKNWKGATWPEKVFTIALDMILEKGWGVTVLEPDTYNRLQDHLANNEAKMQQADMRCWHVWCWEIYHDPKGIQQLDAGDMGTSFAPKLRKIKKTKPVKKLRRPRRKSK